VVIVLPETVLKKFILALLLTVIVLEQVNPPLAFIPLPWLNVPVNPVKFKFKQLTVEPTVQVTVPEAASKNTSSDPVGTA
jgi:hypothetical protein